MNGIECCNNQTSSYSLATTIVCWMGLKLHENFINSLVNRHTNMSDMMCCNCFVGSQTFHGSHIHFRVCIVSHDMIECGVTWKRI